MLDSGTKAPENRIHLFDPVGLINDSYGSYRSSSYAVRPRRPTKSYDSFTAAETSTPGGLRHYDSFTESSTNTTGALRSDDSLTDSNNGGLRSYDHSPKDTNGGVLRSYDHGPKDTNGGALELRFGVDSDESDASTPRLWKPTSAPNPNSVSPSPLRPTSPTAGSSPLHPTSPKSVTSSPLHPASPKPVGSPVNPPVNPTHHQYQTMSPSTRTQVIAKGRKELMEMVRELPESFYELSLKDIVEQKPVMEKQKEIDLPAEQKLVKETAKEKAAKKQKTKNSGKKVKKSDSKKKMVRSRSVDSGGFLLRTSVFPSFLSKKRKKSLSAASSFKIAPASKPQPAQTRHMKGTEKDWWKRKSCISSESEESHGLSSNSGSSSSSGSSSRSNSSNGRRSNKFLRSFCFFNGRRIRGKT